MMKISRRSLLKASLGATQIGLLGGLARAPRASAQSANGGPSKVLTIYLSGGWMSANTACGLTQGDINAVIPAPFVESREPAFFNAGQVVNIDGSSGSSGEFAAFRMAKTWDEASLSQGLMDSRNGTSPHGWSWVQHRLWENAVAIHGVDWMTAAHQAGSVSAMCGVASSDFKSPALGAWAAEALHDLHPERPLPSVWISGPEPAAPGLSGIASAQKIPQLSDIEMLFSRRRGRAWDGLRPSEFGSTVGAQQFDGTAVAGGLQVTPLEDRTMRRLRSMRGLTNAKTQNVLEQLHDGLLSVSEVLARDVTALVENTQGVQYTPTPFWAPGDTHFATDLGDYGTDAGTTWNGQFDLALKLLKADVCTSVAIEASGTNYYNFDGGHADGHRRQFATVRSTFDVIGRLLGEMKATPGSAAGRTLLDDTLVVMVSDFSRTWPSSGPTCDHWPTGTVVMAGGGLNANRMVGGYNINPANPNLPGFDGLPVTIAEQNGNVQRRPRTSDVVTTALAVLGVEGVRIPGGNGEIVGIRAG